MPAGHYSDGEVEADYGVHGEHQRRGQSGEQQRSHVVIGPMPRRTAPAQAEQAEDPLPDFGGRAIAQRGQIRNPHGIGVREHPIEQPRPAHVQQREHARAGHREQRHGLGEPIDRVAPALIQQKQNRRNQRAGVSDADPPHEVRDGESPADRDHDAPNADAFGEQQCHRP